MVIALAVLLVTTLVYDSEEPVWLAWAGYLWFGVVVYLVLALLVLEPVRLALRRWARRAPELDPEPEKPAMDRRLFLARASAAAAGVTALGVTGIGAQTALSAPPVLRVPVGLRRMGAGLDGYRIAVVSDIHLGALLGRSHTERIVRMINETEPDLVAIVGDLVDGSVDQLGRAAEPLRDLVSRDGSFFVTGNHEYFSEDPPSWIRELDRLGVQSLQNESTRITRGTAAFDLAGVNDIGGARFDEPPDFDRALAGTDPSSPTVLLAHQPVLVGESAARGVDLQLSGHTHGGQMWPFRYVVRMAQPALAGMSTHRDTQLYVTRGAGFWGPPVRVGAPPDITVLTLQA